MTTTIRVGRRGSFSKSDMLREDIELAAESAKLGAWLASRELDLVTMNQVLAFTRTEHSQALLDRSAIDYEWVWDPVRKLWYQQCVDRGVVAYELDSDDPAVEIHIEISARY